ncbi:ATP-dependent DNA helicase PIF1 [Paramuricea clavata]|uniref:ATP-dependent DNA helicase n=1 Tax=Paramuricea clavata TaxID=317549 RepID=A0A6S7GQ22_PARCT|nr:ATP-dependent DNA helicase PIF1 [Paramuricea clavata]
MDEISMSSQRIFHIVNAIHHRLSNNDFPFGGIQLILVGDFWQLKPIPSPLDAGRSVYTSELFDKVFPHRVELKRVLRQRDEEEKLKNALDNIREGLCSDEVEEYFKYLERELSSNDVVEPSHIYFKRLPVEVHNLNVLASLPGELTTFESKDTGNGRFLEKTVGQVLAFKPGCRVMLVYNINDVLKNGYRGQYVGVDPDNEERLLVNFPNVGHVAVSRRTWYKYDITGRVQGSRTQFPLSLCYAITVHKSQSLTLDSAVIHCSPEFVPGQTYVALSRVTTEATLQVLGFRRSYLLPPPYELLSLVTNQMGDVDANVGCCTAMHLEENWFECYEEREKETDEMDHDVVVNDDFPSSASQFFESNGGVPVNLEDVLLCMSDFSDELSLPPSSFTVKTFLENVMNDNNEDSYSEAVKSAAKYGVNNLEIFELLTLILWCRIFQLFEDYFTENMEEMQMTNKDFTCATSKLQHLFLSQEYRSDVISAFNVTNWLEIDDGKRSVSALLVFHLFQLFGEELGKRVRKEEETVPIDFNVHEMGPEGRGKVRYIGGWVISKAMHKARSYVVDNKLSESITVRIKINERMKRIELLENNVVITHEAVRHSSANQETLNLTESRQYRGRGLIHIKDDAFRFFLALEQERINKINVQRLSCLQHDLVDDSIAEALKNTTLKTAFTALFNIDANKNKDIIVEMYNEVIERYFKMGAGQSLRDFRRDFHVKKSLAHRKEVMEKKKKAEENQMKVHLPEIEQDRSASKKVSHVRLLALVNKLGEGGLKRLYKKNDLHHLCDAYNVRWVSRWNKVKLASELAISIPLYDAIPCHQITSTYAVNLVQQNAGRVPVLRIRRL